MNQEPSQLLRLAEQHVLRVPADIQGISKTLIDEAIDHAIQAIILAAASIESAVNIAIAQPACYIQPLRSRRHFAELVRHASKAPIREKIALLLRHHDGFALTVAQKKQIKELFDTRNRIVHSTPEYEEVPATERNLRGLPPEIATSVGPVLSVLKTGNRSTRIFDRAKIGVAIAHYVVSQLK